MTPLEFKGNELRLIKVGFQALIALFLFSFFSKAAVGLFIAIAYCLSVFIVSKYGRDMLQHKSLISILLAPLIFGVAASVFTQSGEIIEIAEFINFFKFFLIPISLAVLVRSQQATEWLIAAALISLLIALVYGVFDTEQWVFGEFHGYYGVGRTADMLMITLLASLVFLDDRSFREYRPKFSITLAVLIPFFLVAFYMTSIRGAWLGFGVALLGYTLFSSRKWLIPLILLTATVSVFAENGQMIREIQSITDLESNYSNLARLQIWQTGIDFSKQHFWFGAGEQGIKQQFLNFFEQQPAVYQEIFHLAPRFPGDFHNSYLQIFIQWGMFTSIALLVSLILLFYRLIRAIPTTPPEGAVYIRAFLVVSIGFLISQVFHGDLYSYGGTIYFLLMYGAIQATSLPISKEG